jgi:hypothetical protein
MDQLVGLSMGAPSGFFIKKLAVLNIGGFRVSPEPLQVPDLELSIILVKKSMLWILDEPLCIKREGWGNSSSDKKIVLPAIEQCHIVLLNSFASEQILFKKFLINMWMVCFIRNWACLDKDDVSCKIPARYYSRLYVRFYYIFKEIYRLFIYNFR